MHLRTLKVESTRLARLIALFWIANMLMIAFICYVHMYVRFRICQMWQQIIGVFYVYLMHGFRFLSYGLALWNVKISILKPSLLKHAFCFEFVILGMKIKACLWCFFLLVYFFPIMFVINNVVCWSWESLIKRPNRHFLGLVVFFSFSR
jgi:hypothetical protein